MEEKPRIQWGPRTDFPLISHVKKYRYKSLYNQAGLAYSAGLSIRTSVKVSKAVEV